MQMNFYFYSCSCYAAVNTINSTPKKNKYSSWHVNIEHTHTRKTERKTEHWLWEKLRTAAIKLYADRFDLIKCMYLYLNLHFKQLCKKENATYAHILFALLRAFS